MQSKTAKVTAIKEILEALLRLQQVAKQGQFDMLHYLIEMAFMEAQDILKQLNRAS